MGKSLKIKDLLLKRVLNIVAKAEIAHYEQYLLLSRCFKRLYVE